MKRNLLLHLDQIPPCIARLCARKNAKAKSLREIARDSGLSYQTVNWIAIQPTWEGVTVGDALRFSIGCGLDLLRPRQKLFYLRRAWSRDGIKTIGRGLTQGYVTKQIRIRQDYENTGKAPKVKGRPRKKEPIGDGKPQGGGSNSGSGEVSGSAS